MSGDEVEEGERGARGEREQGGGDARWKPSWLEGESVTDMVP